MYVMHWIRHIWLHVVIRVPATILTGISFNPPGKPCYFVLDILWKEQANHVASVNDTPDPTPTQATFWLKETSCYEAQMVCPKWSSLGQTLVQEISDKFKCKEESSIALMSTFTRRKVLTLALVENCCQ